MATKSISTMKQDIRIALDHNRTSASLLADVDALSLDELIESKIEDAARIVTLNAPYHLLDAGTEITGSVSWDGGSTEGKGSGSIKLPDNYLRLLSFKMSDWSMAVHRPIGAEAPLYKQQKSKYGIKGNPERPVVAIVNRGDGLYLEFYSCTGGSSVTTEYKQYIAKPSISSGNLTVCEKLYRPSVYYAASMVASTLGDSNLSASLQGMAQELMK